MYQDWLKFLVSLGVVAAGLIFFLFLMIKGLNDRIRYQNYIKLLKSQGKYDDWKAQNHKTYSQLKIVRWILIGGYVISTIVLFFPNLKHLSLSIYCYVSSLWLVLVAIYYNLYKKVPRDN